jgi:hypothetical protein
MIRLYQRDKGDHSIARVSICVILLCLQHGIGDKSLRLHQDNGVHQDRITGVVYDDGGGDNNDGGSGSSYNDKNNGSNSNGEKHRKQSNKSGGCVHTWSNTKIKQSYLPRQILM